MTKDWFILYKNLLDAKLTGCAKIRNTEQKKWYVKHLQEVCTMLTKSGRKKYSEWLEAAIQFREEQRIERCRDALDDYRGQND